MNITAKALSDLAKCSRAAVCKATKEGRLTRGEDGLYDPTDTKNARWLLDSERKRGCAPADLKAAINKETDQKDTRASFHWPLVDFLDGRGYVPTAAGKVVVDDSSDLDDEWIIGAIPRAVRIVFGPHGSMRFFDQQTGREYPTKEAQS